METNFSDIVARVLQWDTLVPYVFIICPDNGLRISIDLIKKNSFTLKKGKEQTIPHRNYYGRRLCRCYSTSFKYTHPSQILAAL